MADGGRCLSDLPDDLLRHILFFAPAMEGATTAVLSRRWRWLWRTSGAVNLDSRSLKRRRYSDKPSNKKRSRNSTGGSSSNTAMFLRGAKKALAAPQIPIRRLTFFIAENIEINLMKSWSSGHSLMQTLLSDPAALCVEELRIEVKPLNLHRWLSLGSLPSEALQVLRIVNCELMTAVPPPPLPPFPRLAELYLHGCIVCIEHLSSTIAAAPQLSTLHLQCCYFYLPAKSHPVQVFQSDVDVVSVCRAIACPAVTALVFAHCTFQCLFGIHRISRLEIDLDTPRLQYFRYEGSVVVLTSQLRLKKHASDNMIQQVDLRLTYGRHDDAHRRYKINNGIITVGDSCTSCSCTRFCKLFWRFIQSFDTTRTLKLKLDLLMDELVLADKAIKDLLLGSLSFCRLERLELEGKYMPGFEISMALLADLLRCCPLVRDLRLNFSKVELPVAPMRSSINKEEADDDFLVMLERENPSVRRWILANRDKKLDNVGGHAKDIKLQGDGHCQVYGIPGLTSEHTFSCLQNHLKRVSLNFGMDEPTSLGVNLAKFFAENAMVLQEIHVHDCGEEMLEHLNPSVRRLMAANIRRSSTK